jgi:hypothetical protein
VDEVLEQRGQGLESGVSLPQAGNFVLISSHEFSLHLKVTVFANRLGSATELRLFSTMFRWVVYLF